MIIILNFIGYRPLDSASVKARKWLIHYAQNLCSESTFVQSAESAEGEAKLRIGSHVYKPDGLVSFLQVINMFHNYFKIRERVTRRPLKILEFLGCAMHGCKHFLNRDLRLIGGQTARELYNKTQRRLHLLRRETGLPLEVIWECEWDRVLQEDPQLSANIKALQIIEPIHPRRDALRGGMFFENDEGFFKIFRSS